MVTEDSFRVVLDIIPVSIILTKNAILNHILLFYGVIGHVNVVDIG